MDMQHSFERARLAALRSFQILDTPPEPEFDRLTQFAARICETPIATITFVDEKRQWFKSAIGLGVPETDRAISFCTHTIESQQPFVVSDAFKYPEFRHNPLVTGAPHLRFYAGIPLRTADGYALGAMAVMDTVPRKLTPLQQTALEMLGEQVVVHIELRRRRQELEQMAAERDQINAALIRQAEHLRQAQRIAGVGSWSMDAITWRIACSEEIYRIFGMTQVNQTEECDSFIACVHPEDRERVLAGIRASLHDRTPLDIEHRIERPDGDIRYVHARAEHHFDANGQHMLSGTVQDITEQRRSQERLHLLKTCIARLNDIIMITEAQPFEEPGPRIVFVNQAFEQCTGYRQEEVLGRSPRLLQGPNTQRAELDRIRSALMRKEPVSAELINYTKAGDEFWLELDIVPVTNGAGEVTHYAAIQRDITQRKSNEQEIERLAFYDSLTGLPNRRLLLDRLQHALALAGRNRHSGALLFIDLDNFKTLNDTLGHDKGDLLLQQIAQRLAACVRKSNTVARFGGDEFVVMLEELSPKARIAAAQAEFVAEKILASFHEPFQLGGYDYHSTPSIGVALFNKHDNNLEELLKRADLAMYQAKASGRNAIRFFDPEMQAIVTARVNLEREFRRSLQRQDFILHYQPQTDGMGHVIGMEALVRWQHPRLGLVFPQTFIPLAEETGLIMRLGQWVLETACTQLAAWTERPPVSEFSIAVNVSAREFRHPEFVERALAIIKRTGADPGRLKLELTETVLVENLEDTIAKMSTLKAHGVSFSLDDFGTGYSSLAYLKRLPLDQLKIDQSFVRDVLTDANDAAIARTIVALGQTLGLKVIAEGVETEDQRDYLAEFGCHAYQGNLFSRPLPAEQF
ncbi:EAL domain-containing protein [Noviherbaspirillum agri]